MSESNWLIAIWKFSDVASTQRLERIQGQMLREVSDIVHQMKDPRVQGININEVVVSKDLSYATVYVSIIGEEDIQRTSLTALRRAAGHIRSQIARRIHLRYAPELRIEYDRTAERAARVLSLIDEMDAEKDER